MVENKDKRLKEMVETSKMRKELDFRLFEEEREIVNEKTELNIPYQNELRLYPTEDVNYYIEVGLKPAEKRVSIDFWFQGIPNNLDFKVDRFGIKEMQPEGYRLVLFHNEAKGTAAAFRVTVIGRTSVTSWLLREGDPRLKEIMSRLILFAKPSDFTGDELGEIAGEIAREVSNFGTDFEKARDTVERWFNSQGVKEEVDKAHVLNLVSTDLPDEWEGLLQEYFLRKADQHG